ncbi:MAG: haloalkane dehalogenase [Candidatus Methylomirabilia bacterium]
MRVLRTPDDRFENLTGYPFQARYAQVAGFRVHYVDEGQGEPVLMLHGEPTWSYLYRKMIPLIASRHRAIVPDLVGFGRSDKLPEPSDYSFARHVAWMTDFVEALGLSSITLVGQDWGGLIGLRVAAEHPDRFRALVLMNTGLPTGDEPPGEAFLRWRSYSQRVPDLPIGRVISGGCKSELPPEVIAAYEAPFPDASFKAGARIFPILVPITPEDPAAPANRAAWKVLEGWTKPVQLLFSDGDPITRGWEPVLRERIPGVKGQPQITIQGAGHFLQEDKGEEIAREILAFLDRTA